MRTFFVFHFVLAVLSVSAQDSCKLKFLNVEVDYSGYLFFTQEKITDISFYIIPGELTDAVYFEKMLKKQPFVKKAIRENSSSDTLLFKAKLKYHPSAAEMRNMLEKTGLTVFHIKGNRYWINSLMTNEEAHRRASEMDLKTVPYSASTNNPEMPEYYEYKLYSLKTKLLYMMQTDYAKHFYNGYVTQFHDLIDGHMKDTEDYYNRIDN